MRRTIFCVFLAIILLSIAVMPVQAAPLQAPTAYEVIAAVNALRASYGLDPYLVDGLLMISAQGQADYLASQYPNVVDGHTGPGGTDADARALAVGFPYVTGLDINENWACLPESVAVEMLISQVWGDEVHMHTMLHQQGQLVGVGVASNDGQYYYVLDVAAYWGDAGLTPQPTTMAYGENAATQQYVSQYIAPVSKAEPAADGSITHVVQSGQSLWMLAIHYGVKIDTLRLLNGLGDSDMIYIGQKIKIRGPTPPTATSETTETTVTPKPSVIIESPTPFTAIPLQTEGQNGLDLSFEHGLWFLIFFGLFALGLILIIIGTAER
jgi:LysM repeat protein